MITYLMENNMRRKFIIFYHQIIMYKQSNDSLIVGKLELFKEELRISLQVVIIHSKC